MLDWLGWVATAVFASSYFFKEQVVLRRIQAAAALLWVAYGAMIHALPVVVANLVVASVAVWSTLLRRGEPSVVPVKAEE
jgi:multisubunit Na+/H+ antiporter MnhE subunit